MRPRHVIQLDSGRPRSADVLVIASLHPFPPRSGAAARVAQYARYLAARGLGVDLAALSDGQPVERDRLAAEAALHHCRQVTVMRHPFATSPLARICYRVWGRVVGFRLGDRLHCPPRFERLVRSRFTPRRYRAVIISGTQLGRLADLFRPPTLRILDARDVWQDRCRSYAAMGRAAEVGISADPAREARLVERFDAVLALTSRDQALLRELGVKRPIHVMPIAADRELLGLDPAGVEAAAGLPEWPADEPVRPPRILFVGTEASSNLDGLRFFRHRVFPAVRRQSPSCRLRVVGQCARHLDPGPGVDLVGWVDRLADEYRAAAAVAAPLRMGSGLRTKVVEALAHGKALLTTPVGAQGIDLEPGRDAVVSDDPAVLAREAIRILTDASARRSYESNAAALAARLFDPATVFRPLRDLLGLDQRAPGHAGRMGAPMALKR